MVPKGHASILFVSSGVRFVDCVCVCVCIYIYTHTASVVFIKRNTLFIVKSANQIYSVGEQHKQLSQRTMVQSLRHNKAVS